MTPQEKPATGDGPGTATDQVGEQGRQDDAGRQPAPGAAEDTPSGETPGEGGERPAGKRRRGSRGGRRRRKPADGQAAGSQETVAQEAPGSQEPAPIVAEKPQAAPQSEPAASAPPGEAETGAEGAGEAPHKRRRRGSRGGRRRHKAVDAEAAEAAREAEDASGEPPSHEPVAAGALTAAEAVEAPAAESAAATPRAPRSRRSRSRRKPAAAAAAEPGGETAQVTPGEAGAESAVTAPPIKEQPRAKKGRGRGRKAIDDASSVAARPQAAESGAAETGAPESGAPESGATDDGEPRKRRRRGARGGRRTRAQADAATIENGVDDGAEAVVAMEEDDGPPAERPARSRRPKAAAQLAAEEVDEPATIVQRHEKPEPEGAREDEKPAARAGTKQRRREHRRPRAIVRQDEGSGLGRPDEQPARRPAVTAQLPERKIILVTDDGRELRVALVEDGRLAEIYIERPDKKSYLGDIYQGKVDNVLVGIDAAFVDFGLEKNGFLYVDEVLAPDGEKRARRIGDALKNGQQVLVQVTKDPMGSKGARLSTKISLAGRYLVYVPGGSGVGVSRRLGQSERERLRDISKQLKPKNAGLIVRTIAEGHGLEDLKRDLQYLSRLWSRLKKKAETVKPPGLVHKEVDVSIEVARDLFNESCESLIVDDPKRHKTLLAFLDKEAPELVHKVHLHTGAEPLFEAYGIEEQIARALERRVPLASGGNLVIDHAEALTVIDVNTGRFAGGKGLEETITHTNLEAAREVVRQLRLRDIGGIIIIDFIDMARAKNREMVLATLEAELETDRTKTYVVELSPLGLVEMTRQNTTDGARGILTRSCPACSGKARVLSDETMALNVERRVRTLARRSQAKAWLVEINAAVADRLTGDRLKRLEKEIGRRVFLEGGSALSVDAFRVVSEGSVAHVQEQRVPVREGQEVEVELEFSLTYSPRDAVGYIDGYMVIVEGGRQYLGQRRKVKITSTARTGAAAVALRDQSN